MDDFYMARHRPFLATLRDGDRVMTKHKGRLEVNYIAGRGDDRGVAIEGEHIKIGEFHKHGLSAIWNGPMPDDDDMAKRYVRWREENGDRPFLAWIVVAAPDHFMVTPLLDFSYNFVRDLEQDNEGQLFTGERGLVPMRGTIAAQFHNEADTFCPGDLVMAKLTRADISKTAFTYQLDQVVGLGTFDDVRKACRSIDGSHYAPEPGEIRAHFNYHASTRMMREEEDRALARAEPNEALVLVEEGALSVLDHHGIVLHDLEDAGLYLETGLPDEDGIYYLDQIANSYSHDWESGHVDLEVEANWQKATSEQASRFFDRVQLENELKVGYDIADPTPWLEAIYGDNP